MFEAGEAEQGKKLSFPVFALLVTLKTYNETVAETIVSVPITEVSKPVILRSIPQFPFGRLPTEAVPTKPWLRPTELSTNPVPFADAWIVDQLEVELLLWATQPSTVVVSGFASG